MCPGRTRKFWSGRRDSNPRPRPWQGRALPLSYTRIREIGGERSPTTGRAMPNAALECNSWCETQNRLDGSYNGWSPAESARKRAKRGSTDCKLGFQAPIRAGKVLEHPQTSGEDSRDDNRAG